jgi:putative ABC transport system permease protein
MPRLVLFYRLIVRPFLGEPARTLLMVLSVALGVAVVLAIDLAGDAAAGSFHSSMETLTGDSNLEITAAGGVPDSVAGLLATLPYAMRVSPRVEGYAVVEGNLKTVPVIGVDLIGERDSFDAGQTAKNLKTSPQDQGAQTLSQIADHDAVWVSSGLGKKPGDSLRLQINDEVHEFIVRGIYLDSGGDENVVIMDIAAAQDAFRRTGRLDRILLKVPAAPGIEEWQRRLRSVLPAGIDVEPRGTSTNENRTMLAAFRLNLRLLSYISLVVGAFLIFNTISVSVVRRRPEIGIVRALGASRTMILAAFVGEAACLGAAGAAIGLPLGRAMATGAVKLIGVTVQSLYVSSTPGPIALTMRSVFLAFVIGIGIAIASAYAPAREASLVSPVEAMARGRREYQARVHKIRDLWIALFTGLGAAAASFAPAVSERPIFGYVAVVLLIVASALMTPALVAAVTSFSSNFLGKMFGVEALLASRSLLASLRRTSVLVGALSTAVAMMVSVGIMVGSFRETVLQWMNNELPADFYIRPAGDPGPDRHPTISPGLAEQIANLPGVAAVDRLRVYEISFDGLPVTLAAADLRVPRSYHSSQFFSGSSSEQVFAELNGQDAVLVSEPFTYKHHVKIGDSIRLSLGEKQANFRIADVYYDYSSERGTILMSRETLLRYLADPAPSNIAIYTKPEASSSEVRAEIEKAAAGKRVIVASNRELRAEAIRIFDRTFAITYALEAVAVLVAIMGIAGALLVLVMDRQREIGLLRFLGGATGQLRKLILVEAGYLGLLANVVGLALGFALSLILVYVINKQSFGWTIRFHWPVAVVFGGLTAVYAATLLAGLYPAHIAVGLNPLEVIREE